MARELVQIYVDEEADLYISDILCWVRGYFSGTRERLGDNEDESMLNPAINILRDINLELKGKLKRYKPEDKKWNSLKTQKQMTW